MTDAAEMPGPIKLDLAGAADAVHRFAHEAMGCTFELYLVADDANYAGQCAAEAFERIDALERQLSRFVEDSEIAQINAIEPGRAVAVSETTLELLQLACCLHAETGSAFDITVGHRPAGTPSGMDAIGIDPQRHCVGLTRAGVQLDLGGIGKGFAIDQIAGMLRDWSIDNALIHAGKSTVLAIGDAPGARGWPVCVRDPVDHAHALRSLHLVDRALSGSGTLLHGNHIIDPRTGEPARGILAAWAAAPTAAVSDALSTAFMIATPRDAQTYCTNHPHTSVLLMQDDPVDRTLLHFGVWDNASHAGDMMI